MPDNIDNVTPENKPADKPPVTVTGGAVMGAFSAGGKANVTPEAEAFLDMLRPGGPWLLTAILPDDGNPKTITKTVTSLKEVRRFIDQHNPTRGIYYSVNPVKRRMNKKAAKTDIAQIEYIFADLDPEGDETPEAAKLRFHDALASFTVPTALVDSGGGLQGLWRLAEALPPEDLEKAEAASRGIMVALGGDTGTANVDRILRVPGTTNLPNEVKRKKGRTVCEAHLLAFNDGVHRLDAFPTAEKGTKSKGKAEGNAKAKAEGPPPDLADIIKNGPGDHFPDRHSAVWWVCNEARRQGWPDDKVIEALIDPDNQISESIREKPDHRVEAQRNIDRARERAESGVQLTDFVAYMPQHAYIFRPTGELWPSSSVNARIPPIGKTPASDWLDRYSPVDQMTWCPGMDELIKGRLVAEGGWIERPGSTVYNRYRPPIIQPKAGDVGPWLKHVKLLCGDQTDHTIKWLAHRVQRPGEKINHALVLGGPQGIGKDTILEPVKQAVGPWNFHEVSPANVFGQFNGFLKSVILRVSEARDLGDADRFKFYDHTKTYTAAPPDVLRINEKHIREHYIFNVVGVIITSNHKTDGIYLPADDRRHFVVWSPKKKEDFTPAYWNKLWGWYANGGIEAVAHYLANLDLSGWDPKAPPPQTAAFWEVVNASRAPEDAELMDILALLDNPDAVTLNMVKGKAESDFGQWLGDRRNARRIPHRFEECGYVVAQNPGRTDGRWQVSGRTVTVYVKQSLTMPEKIKAVRKLAASDGGDNPF